MTCLLYDHSGLVGEKPLVVQPLTGIVSMGPQANFGETPLARPNNPESSQQRLNGASSFVKFAGESMLDLDPVPAVMAGAGVQQHDRERLAERGSGPGMSTLATRVEA